MICALLPPCAAQVPGESGRPSLPMGQAGPFFAKFGPISKSGRICPKLAESARSSAKVGQAWPKFAKDRTNSAESRSIFGHIRPHLVKAGLDSGPNSVHTGPDHAEVPKFRFVFPSAWTARAPLRRPAPRTWRRMCEPWCRLRPRVRRRGFRRGAAVTFGQGPPGPF